MGSDCFRHFEQKSAVFDALLELLCERPFSEVGVADVLERSRISRSAFYRLFPGMKGVVVWHTEMCSALGTFAIGRHLTCAQGHRVSIGLLADASALYANLFRWWSYDYSLPAVNAHVDAMACELRERGIAMSARTEYELAGVAHSSHEIACRWFNGGMNVPVDELVDIIVSLYPSWLREELDSPREPLDPAQLAVRLMGESGRRNRS